MLYVVQSRPVAARARGAVRHCPASAQGVFTLTSPSFKDGERLAVKNAGNNKSNPNCVGENVSPALPGRTRRKAPRASRS